MALLVDGIPHTPHTLALWHTIIKPGFDSSAGHVLNIIALSVYFFFFNGHVVWCI